MDIMFPGALLASHCNDHQRICLIPSLLILILTKSLHVVYAAVIFLPWRWYSRERHERSGLSSLR